MTALERIAALIAMLGERSQIDSQGTFVKKRKIRFFKGMTSVYLIIIFVISPFLIRANIYASSD
jgi:hypothetical protein